MSRANERATAVTPDLTLATWNVCLGAEFEPLLSAGPRDSLVDATRKLLDGMHGTRFPDRAEALARVIARHRPDVLGLQELGRWQTGDGDEEQLIHSFPDIMLEALAAAGAPYVMIHCVDTVTGQLPVDGRQWARFTSCDALFLRLDPDVDLSVIEIDDGHYASYLTGELAGGARRFPIRRGWVSVDLERNNRRTRVIVTHLDSLDADVRRAQAHELVALASTSPYPVVMLGDLNADAAERVDGPIGRSSSHDGVLDVLANAGYADAWSCCEDLAALPSRSDSVTASTGGEGVELLQVRGATWGPVEGLRAPDDASPAPDLGRDLTRRLDFVFFDPEVIEAKSSQVVGIDAGDVTTTTPRLFPSDHGCLLARLAFRSR